MFDVISVIVACIGWLGVALFVWSALASLFGLDRLAPWFRRKRAEDQPAPRPRQESTGGTIQPSRPLWLRALGMVGLWLGLGVIILAGSILLVSNTGQFFRFWGIAVVLFVAFGSFVFLPIHILLTSVSKKRGGTYHRDDGGGSGFYP